ncbi:hypothetical protein ACFGVR_15390 [Mucilaginibacter sp. AW1-3]
MKHTIIVICILIGSILGCQNSFIIDNNNIRAIKFYLSKDNHVPSEITDKNNIQRIVAELNRAKRELAVFKAICTLKIVYADGKEQLVLCNNNRIKVNGLTYTLNKSITEIMDE